MEKRIWEEKRSNEQLNDAHKLFGFVLCRAHIRARCQSRPFFSRENETKRPDGTMMTRGCNDHHDDMNSLAAGQLALSTSGHPMHHCNTTMFHLDSPSPIYRRRPKAPQTAPHLSFCVLEPANQPKPTSQTDTSQTASPLNANQQDQLARPRFYARKTSLLILH